MSLIALQLGQCGNQLGQSFFTNLDNEASNLPPAYANCIRNTFFTETQKKFIANAVLIDMEPKVVNNCLA